MTNWIERAKREIPQSTSLTPANTDERHLTAVTAVTSTRVGAISGFSIGSNDSTRVGNGREIVSVDEVNTGESNRTREKAELIHMRSGHTAASTAFARHWLIQFGESTSIEVYFSWDATHAEALASYAGATAAEPVVSGPKRAATRAEAAELRHLIQLVLKNEPDEQDEALAHALADPVAALRCFRALAVEISACQDKLEVKE